MYGNMTDNFLELNTDHIDHKESLNSSKYYHLPNFLKKEINTSKVEDRNDLDDQEDFNLNEFIIQENKQKNLQKFNSDYIDFEDKFSKLNIDEQFKFEESNKNRLGSTPNISTDKETYRRVVENYNNDKNLDRQKIHNSSNLENIQVNQVSSGNPMIYNTSSGPIPYSSFIYTGMLPFNPQYQFAMNQRQNAENLIDGTYPNISSNKSFNHMNSQFGHQNSQKTFPSQFIGMYNTQANFVRTNMPEQQYHRNFITDNQAQASSFTNNQFSQVTYQEYHPQQFKPPIYFNQNRNIAFKNKNLASQGQVKFSDQNTPFMQQRKNLNDSTNFSSGMINNQDDKQISNSDEVPFYNMKDLASYMGKSEQRTSISAVEVPIYRDNRNNSPKIKMNRNLENSPVQKSFEDIDNIQDLEIYISGMNTTVSEYIMTQRGSRNMQKFLNNVNPENLDLLLEHIKYSLKDIMNNVYGNYFSQKLTQCCVADQRVFILKHVS